jgi:rhodanese-related sulfurtransferase
MNNISIKDFINNFDTEYKNYIVLDVRSIDFIGGNIPNAINIEALKYNEIKLLVENKNNIIVHCMYSSLRAPGVVNRLLDDYPNKNILLLNGGFNKYFNEIINNYNKYYDKYIENLNFDYWEFNKDKRWIHKYE